MLYIPINLNFDRNWSIKDVLNKKSLENIATYAFSSQDESGSDSDSDSDDDETAAVAEAASNIVTDEDFVNKGLGFIEDMQPPPPYSEYEPLSSPIVIPQLSNQFGSPFSRAYAPILESRGIEKHDFLEFIDGINIVSTPNIIFLTMLLAAEVLDATNVDVLEMAACGLAVAAVVGTIVVCKRRCKMYLKKSNKYLFNPRGLQVKILSSKELAPLLGVESRMHLLCPFDDDQKDLTIHERRMYGIKDKVYPLDFNVPPPSKAKNLLAKVAAYQVSRSYKTQEEALMKSRGKTMKQVERRDSISSVSSDEDKSNDEGYKKYYKKRDRVFEKLDKEKQRIDERFERKLMTNEDEQRLAIEKEWEIASNRINEKYDKASQEFEDSCNKHESKQMKTLKKCEKKILSKDTERKVIKRLNWIVILPTTPQREG